MREIKFRVAIYDFNKEKYLIKKDLVLANSIWSNADISLNEIIKNAKNLMQYTGLKDKNCVEIYEGDILQDYDNDKIGIVSFDKGSFIVTWENECYDVYEWSGEAVIGNIYENPELLEESKKC